MTTSAQLERRYTDAVEGSLLVQHPIPGVVRMQGDDRLDLLQRMSTNDLKSLNPGHWETTVLTNALARIVDRVSLLHGRDQTFLVTSPERGKVVQEWLQDFIFFQDDVQMQDESGQWSLWSVNGAQRMASLRKMFDQAEELRDGEYAQVDDTLLWACARPLASVCALLPLELNREVEARAATENNLDLNRQVYEILRVEAGLPLYGREFTQESIPLEVGLQHAIDFQKGCYIGQEIIARMHSRGRIPKRLVGLALEDEVPSMRPVYSDGKEVGKATSVVRSPKWGWIALGVVKSSALEQKAQLLVGDSRVPGRIVALPFSQGN